MIYIDENSENMLVPKHLDYSQKPNSLILVNNFTQNTETYNIEDSIQPGTYFYNIDLKQYLIRNSSTALITDGLKDGEYTYYLQHNNTIYEKGLLVYGSYGDE